MKNVNTIILLLLVSTMSVFADEEKFLSFYLSYSDTEYNVFIETDLDKKANIIFEIDNMEYGEYAMLKLSPQSIEPFIYSLNVAKAKYHEWSEIVNNTGKVLYMKKLPSTCQFESQHIYFTCNQRMFEENGLNFFAYFYVDVDGKPYLILRSGRANDSKIVYESFSFGFWQQSLSLSTETISVKGYTKGVQLVFASINEIDAFISVLWQAKTHRDNVKPIKKLLK